MKGFNEKNITLISSSIIITGICVNKNLNCHIIFLLKKFRSGQHVHGELSTCPSQYGRREQDLSDRCFAGDSGRGRVVQQGSPNVHKNTYLH